jgi:pimeloyl-ACP methyl ester carboxylesterase
VIDLPGFGRSPQSSDPSPEGQANALAHYIEERSEEGFVLIGHSLGGGIALLAALKLADRGLLDRLSGLILVSAAVYPQRIPPYLSMARIRGIGELFLLAPPPLWSVRRGLRAIVFTPDSIDNEQVVIQRSPYLSRERRKSLLRAARAIDPRAGESTSSRLSNLRLPTLIIWGEEDPVVPVENGRRLARELPTARLVILPQVGHLPPEESPTTSLAPVLELLEELRVRRAQR